MKCTVSDFDYIFNYCINMDDAIIYYRNFVGEVHIMSTVMRACEFNGTSLSLMKVLQPNQF